MGNHAEIATTAILVNYRSAEETLEAVQALRSDREAGPLSIVVVENASGAGELDRLREGLAKEVRLIESDHNLGFAGGVQLALPSVVGEFVLVLNPDARLERGSLGRMVEFLEAHPRAGVVGPLFMESEERVISSARRTLTPWRVLAAQLGLWSVVMPLPDPPRPFQADWLVGACMLFRKQALLQAGGFDPRYFLYFEEADLCRRLAALGWELWCLPKALCVHEHAPSATRSGEILLGREILRHFLPSRHLYLCRFHGRGGALFADCGSVLLAMAIWVRNILQWWRPQAQGRRERSARLLAEYARMAGRLLLGQKPGLRDPR